MGRKTVLMPKYLKKFQCIGSACEENCCATNWSIYIDRATYQKYRKLKNIPIKILLDKHVTRVRAKPEVEEIYAKIKFFGKEQCPFLNEKNLCVIQLNLGEDYLCDTCVRYPRYTNIIDGKYERAASLSCPEAARIALLNSEGIDFEEVEVDFQDRKLVNFEINTNVGSSYQQYFWELRMFTIQILKSRDYELWERLIILGMFYQSVQECIDQGGIRNIPGIIQKYTTMVIEGIFKESLASIPSVTTVQIKILKELIDERCREGCESPLYLECLSATLEGLNLIDELAENGIQQSYLAAYHEYYHPFMHAHGYILENYLVNYVFKNLFPLSGQKRIFDNYIMMVLHYSLIQIHLIGMAGFYKESFNCDHVIKLIFTFGKTVEQNLSYLARIRNILKENNFDTMAYMAILIKN